MNAALQIVSPGGGGSLQDGGRAGWKRFGVAEGGAMDRDSAALANRLAGNPDDAPVLELFMTGARLKVLRPAEFALTGAKLACSHPRLRSFVAAAGEEIVLAEMRGGVWSYLAVHGGFEGPRWFGSVSVNPRAGFGAVSSAGEILRAAYAGRLSAVSSRFAWEEGSFAEPPVIGVWPGPEWESFEPGERARFLESEWRVSPQCDRSGYRLEGPLLEAPGSPMPSAPLAVGVIQIPPGGHPIVILRDGPTVGGYPRLAMVDPPAVSRFTQCAPGTSIRFHLLA